MLEQRFSEGTAVRSEGWEVVSCSLPALRGLSATLCKPGLAPGSSCTEAVAARQGPLPFSRALPRPGLLGENKQ